MPTAYIHTADLYIHVVGSRLCRSSQLNDAGTLEGTELGVAAAVLDGHRRSGPGIVLVPILAS